MSLINKKKSILYILFSFLIFSIISVIAFVKIHYHVLFGTPDMQFHLKRIMEFATSLQRGYEPNFAFNYFHGSAVMYMYPYLSLYPFIIILKLLHNFIISYYVFSIFVVLLSLLISFFSSLKYSKSVLVSYLFAITYSMSSTFTFELFADGDLGIVTSFIFVPLAIFGFLDILNGSENYLKFTFGIVLMTFSQLPTVIILLLFLSIWYLYNLKSSFTKVIIFSFVKSFILIILLTSIIWIPLVNIILFNNINTVSFHLLVGTDFITFIKHFSIMALITVIIFPIFYKKSNKFNKQMYLLSLIILFISSKLMPWNLINRLPLFDLLNQFQYTFRFLIIPQILLCYLFAYLSIKALQKTNKPSILLIVTLIVILLSVITQFFILIHSQNNNHLNIINYKRVSIINSNLNNNKYFLSNNNNIKYLLNGSWFNDDYYPERSLSQKNILYNNKIKIVKDNNLIHIKHVGYNEFRFNLKRNVHKLILPFVYYKNEFIRIYINNHQSHFVSDHGVITLKNVHRGTNNVRFMNLSNTKLILFKHVLFILGIILVIVKGIFIHNDRGE